MKYILNHPLIEQSIHPLDNPAETHDERDVTHTHQEVEHYAGAGETRKTQKDPEHRLSQATFIDAKAKSIAGQQDIGDPNGHRLSDIAAIKANAPDVNTLHTAPSDDEHRLAEGNEEVRTKIVRFADFQNK